MRNVHFAVLRLDPGQLVNYVVAPLVEALVANVELGIEYPQEAEALHGKMLHGNIDDLLITHCVVLQAEFVVRKHVA